MIDDKIVGKYEAQLERDIRKKLSKKDYDDLNRQTERYNSECGEYKVIIPARNKKENQMKKNNTIFLIVGESGSGKTTIVNELEKLYGLTSIQSYTTRPRRHANEYGHIYINDNQFEQLKNIVAYTEFCGYRYCATQQQVEENDLYIIDTKGIKYFKEHYHGDKNVKVIYVTISEEERANRMKMRGDTSEIVKERLCNDTIEFKNAIDLADFFVTNINFDDTIKVLAEYIRQINNGKDYINIEDSQEMGGFVNGNN